MRTVRIAPPLLVLSCVAGLVAGCGPAASVPASTSPSVSTSASESSAAPSPSTGLASPAAPVPDLVRVPLDGEGPLGIDLDGDHAWVVLTDSGGLAEVDLTTHQVIRTIDIGTGGQQVVASPDGTIYVGRYTTGGVGEDIVEVDAASGSVSGIPLGPIGGLGLDGQQLWALEKTGEVARIDAATGSVTSSVEVHVDQDAHMDLVAADGSAWVSGDRTPVHRISGSDATIEAAVETDGGIPLAFAGGLVWGARPDEVWAIDPATNAVVRRVALLGVDEILALDVDVDADEAWIAVRKPGRVGAIIAVDLASGAVLSDTPASIPAGVRLSADHAWVTDYERDELIGLPRS
jgi:hypothetical protein